MNAQSTRFEVGVNVCEVGKLVALRIFQHNPIGRCHLDGQFQEVRIEVFRGIWRFLKVHNVISPPNTTL